MSKLLIQAQRIQKTYHKGESYIEVLHDLDFELESGTTVAVMGESGVGKSTLLQILGGLLKPSTGEVWAATNNIGECGL